VNGEHSVESMASSLNMGNYRVIGGWSPKEFASKYMGMGDKPLYGDPADVEEARQIILASPEKYGVKQPKTAAAPAQAPAPGLVLQPGTKLYRGIGEDEIHNHAPASDGCLWTTESITIARTYIPASGLSLITTLEGIVQPPQERGGMEGLQKQLGFEYTDIKYEANGRPNSYRLPALMDKLVPEPHPDEKQFKTKNEYWDASHAWQDKRKKALENYVKQKLSEYGYEPEKSSFGGGRYDLMVDWQNGQNVLLPNKFQEGTVCVFEVVQPLNIYDMTEGGKVQGDLLDPQYREYGKFGTIAAAGYDGVKIEDYAQVEGHGNVGHTSIGIFKNGVPKIKEVERQTATHPEDLYGDIKKYGSADEPGLLWRAGEANNHHDYQPSWDYEPRAENDPELAQIAVQCAKGEYERFKQPFELWDVDLSHTNAVAMYIDGTCGYPVVLIDLEAHRGYEKGIGKSINHELKHSIQEAEGREYDEDEAESDE
jgi:hypothetical protein